MRIGELFEEEENYEAAAKTYEKCIKYESPEGFLKLGELQLVRDEVASAIENLEKAACFYRDDDRLKLKLAYGYSLYK